MTPAARDMNIEVQCPYCGESFALAVDGSGGREQQFTSDCEVCCRPILFLVAIDELGEIQVEARAETGD